MTLLFGVASCSCLPGGFEVAAGVAHSLELDRARARRGDRRPSTSGSSCSTAAGFEVSLGALVAQSAAALLLARRSASRLPSSERLSAANVGRAGPLPRRAYASSTGAERRGAQPGLTRILRRSLARGGSSPTTACASANILHRGAAGCCGRPRRPVRAAAPTLSCPPSVGSWSRA
ncbi:MAG: hypothetical protein MZV49_06095 [Rhodopseudomonas palustris]|nr:hypothetical protein [Rhodopseudomonas palustris]